MLALNATLSWRRKDCTPCIDHAAVGGNKGALRMFAHAANAGLESVGQQAVVGIEKNEELTAALTQPSVACTGKTGIFLINISHRRIARDDIRGAVGRAIVHDDDFEVRITLRQNTFIGLREKLSVVVAGNYHRHPAWVWRSVPFRRFAKRIGHLLGRLLSGEA